MLQQRIHALTDPAELRALVDRNGWTTLVSTPSAGEPVVSHLPVIVDDGAEELTVLGHLARSDAEEHELGEHEVVLVVQGPHGYISPSVYEAGPYVPTWNFVVAHLYGRPEVLDDAATYRVLSDTVDHFEAAAGSGWRLDSVTEYANRLAPHTTGFRLRPRRTIGKAKLSQDKPADVAARVVTALASAPHVPPHAALVGAMRTHLSLPPEPGR